MLSDLRVTLRGLLKTPSFTVMVIGTLALGLGAATAVFSVVHAVLLRPLPFVDAGRVLLLGEQSAASASRLVSPVTFDDWRTRQVAFEEIAAFRYWETVNLEDSAADPQPVTLTTGTDNLFRALGVSPQLGRTYREEQSPQGGSEAVISHELWQRRYQGDPSVLGRVIRVRGTATTIVGVMPPLPQSVATGWGDVWTCLYRYDIAQQRASGYRARYLTIVGRLAPGVSFEQAALRMQALQRQLWDEPASVADGYDVSLQQIGDVLTGNARVPMLVVAASAAALLFVACANVATLMLVRTASRRRETATRLALGAAPVRVLRLLTLEGAVLAVAGGIAGLGVAQGLLNLLSGIGTALPRFHDAGITANVALVAALISMAAALLCVGAPLFEMRRTNLASALGDSGRSGTPGVQSSRLRRALVAVQVATACVLLITGSLLLKSFDNVLRVDPGFDADPAVYLDLYLPISRYPDAAAHTRFYRDLTRVLAETPGVASAGGLLYFPFKPKLWPVTMQVEGVPAEPGREPVAYYNQVAGAYFAAMDIPLERGRLPTEREMWDPGARRVALINAAMAQQLFAGQDPIGRRIKSGGDGVWNEIIGVVGDVRQQRLDLPAAPEYYTTFQQMPMPFQSIVVRGANGRAPSIAVVQDVLRRLDPGLALANLMPLSDWVGLHTRERQFALWILSSFAVMALCLCSVGVFGAVSYAVAQRRREIGLRLALGASRRGIRALVVKDGIRLVGIGTAIGTLAAVAAAPGLRGLLYGVVPLDPMTYLGVPLLLLGVGLAACWWPARAATRAELASVLRDSM